MNFIRLALLFIIFSSSLLYSSNKIIYQEPKPNAVLVSSENNIIIGFSNVLPLTSSQVSVCMEVSGSQSSSASGSILICENNKKIIFKPSNPFTPGEVVTVKLRGNLLNSISAGKKEYSYSFTVAAKKLKWDPAKSFEDECIRVPNPIFNHNDVQSLPPLTITTDNNPAPGYIFLTNYLFQNYQPYLIITNNHGLPYWYSQLTANCDDFKKEPSGNLTYYDVGIYAHLELNQNYTPIHEFHCGNGYTTDAHELRVLGNGNAYLQAYDPEIVNMSLIVPGGNPNATVVGLIIQEVDPNNNVVFQWRSWDHFAITDAWHQNMDSSYIDCVHGNAIEIDTDSNLIISSRHLDEITKINRTTGDIMWRFGGKNNQFTFLGDTLKFTYQHAIRRIANGDLTLFDNGNYHTPRFSRAVEYSLDEINHTATTVWEYRHTPSIFGFAMGYVQRLSNGNTFICWGYTNPNITEVTPSGNIVFEMSLPLGDLTYRAYKDSWNGNPVAIKQAGENIPLSYKLNQNFPNPFNPGTKITYQVPKSSQVKLSVYDVLGNEVAVLVNQVQQPDVYRVVWNALNFPSGVYFYKLQAGDFTQTRKMTLIK